MRQQYRWCCGATSLVWTRHMWRVQMPWTSRLPYIAGWLWNLTTGLRTLVVPLIPVTLLVFLPGEIQLRNALLLLPAIITGTVLYPLWHNAPYSPRIWPLAIAVGWAQALAIWDYARGKVMSWQPTRGPGDAPAGSGRGSPCGTARWPSRGSPLPPGASADRLIAVRRRRALASSTRHRRAADLPGKEGRMTVPQGSSEPWAQPPRRGR